MLRGIYAPTDFISFDLDPALGPEQKLRAIAAAPVTVKPWRINGKIYDDDFTVSLPYIQGAIFHANDRENESLFTDYVHVGDETLYGHGIGSRLLRAGCRYAVERNKHIKVFTTNWARLGLVNTAISVFGEENVGVDHGIRYGWQGEKPLDAMFDDFPPDLGKKYLVGGIVARIQLDIAMTWEEPVYTLPTGDD
jgi:hypothetical protein